MNLLERRCAPCEKGAEPLSRDRAREMAAQVPNWELDEDGAKIRRKLKLKNFVEAIAVVDRVAELAEGEGHHPDIRIYGWNQIEFTLSTHKIGGLHENDFILAAKIDALLVR